MRLRERWTGGRLREAGAGYVLILPLVLASGAFLFVPIVTSAYWSFTDFSGLGSPTWVGLRNYTDLFADPRFIRALVNTVIFVGLVLAFGMAVSLLPPGFSFGQGVALAGALGKLQGVDPSLRLDTRYTLWSGLLGGLFVQLAYFGTDQSQVQRYLAGGPLAESRRGLLMNGLLKVPMQLFILFIGVMVFVVYQLIPPPLFFNRAELERVRASHPAEVATLESRHAELFVEKRRAIDGWIRGETPGEALGVAESKLEQVRKETGALVARTRPGADSKDADFIFLRFVLDHFPHGLIGLLVAVILSAAMSANSAALSSLGATTVVDFYRPRHPDASDARTLAVARWSTAAWGLVAVGFASFAALLDNLIQAVNILGSLFYGPMLGVFLVGFFLARVRGRAVFWATVAGEIVVLAAAAFGHLGFLWYNVLGCAVVVGLALLLQRISPRPSST